jgi:hypothetical protein
VICGFNLGFYLPLPICEHQASLLLTLPQGLRLTALKQTHARQLIAGYPVGYRALL